MANKDTYSAILSSRAQGEVTSSWNWYEERQAGLGDKFLNEVVSKLQIIEQQPELFAIKHRSFREAVLSTFPLLVIYKINKRKKLVYVLSVFHTSRSHLGKYKK